LKKNCFTLEGIALSFKREKGKVTGPEGTLNCGKEKTLKEPGEGNR